MRYLLIVLIPFLLACGEDPEIRHPNRADLSGLEPWMRPLMIEAAAWWGDTLRHREDSRNHVILATLPTSKVAQYVISRGIFTITFSQFVFWSTCEIPFFIYDYDFPHVAKHEWGHHIRLKHDSDPDAIMYPHASKCLP